MLPRGIVFGLKWDEDFLKQIPDIKKSDAYFHLFDSPEDIFLSGTENKQFAEFVRDSGAYLVFLPHPEIDPLRRKITRAVIKSLTHNIPRILKLVFYKIGDNKTLSYEWDGMEENFFPMLPKVSVIVRYGGSPLIRDALQSLINQTYDHIEVVLVLHSGVKDIDRCFFKDLDIQIITGVQDRGTNLNLGVHHSKGEYIGFLDEDDLLMPTHIETLVSALEANKKFPVAYSNTTLSKWEIKDKRAVFKNTIKTFSNKFSPIDLFFENYIPLNSILFKKEILLMEKFPEGIVAYEDWVLLCKLVLKGIPFLHIDEITAEYRIFENDLYKSHVKKGFVHHSDDAIKLFLKYLDVKAYHILRESFLKQKKIQNRPPIKNKLSKKSKNKNIQYNIEITPSINKETALLISCRDTAESLLDKLINSIIPQIKNYPVKLYALDDGSISYVIEKKIRDVVRQLGKNKVFFSRTWGLGISNAYNFLGYKSKEPYIMFCDHDDELAPNAIKCLLSHIRPSTKLIYSDSNVIDELGRELLVHKKPDWSPDTLLSYNYINHPTLISRELWDKVGGYRERFEGAQDWDFLLQASKFLKQKNVVHIKKILYHWRASPGSVAMHPQEKPWAIEAGKMALFCAIKKRIGNYINLFEKIWLEPNIHGPGFLKKCILNKNEKLPKIRIVIPTFGNIFRINQILDKINKQYPQLYLTIISNGKEISHGDIIYKSCFMDVEIINIKTDTFNWSLMNNTAVKNREEDFFLFLNDDILPDENFIPSLLLTALITGAGVIGATLFFPSLNIQHNGIKTDINSIAHEIRDFGEKGELATLRNVSAVTGAALLCPRDIFFDVNGFEEKLPINYNDVDFCLKVRKKGCRVVISPETKAIHFHMTSRKEARVSKKEIKFMQERWNDFLEEIYFYRWEQKGSRIITMNLREN